MDWKAWHDAYDRPDSALTARLRLVQQQIRAAIDDCGPGPIRVMSLCAGQGRDLIGALADHPRKADVRTLLVELDPRNVDIGRKMAMAAGLTALEFIAGDAAMTDHYREIAPADLVVACGIFGNLSDQHCQRLISFLPRLCRSGGDVIWTHNRRPPDRVPQICLWFRENGFEEQWLSAATEPFGIGRHRMTGPAQPLIPGDRMFEFLPDDELAARCNR